MDQKHHLFRQNALERLSSPERLDQAVRVIRPQDWLVLGVVGALMAVGVIWSWVGRLPITVTGKGILMNPGRMVAVQSQISGQLQAVMVRDGDCVQRHQVLATIDPSDLKQQHHIQQEKLVQLQQQAQEDRQAREQRSQLERDAIAAQQTSLSQQLRDAQSLTPVLQSQSLGGIASDRPTDRAWARPTAITLQRKSLQQRLKDAQELAPILQTRLRDRQALAAAGALSRDTLLEVEREARQAHQEIANLEAELEQLHLQEAENQQRYVDNLSTISQLKVQLEELQTRSQRLEQENLEARQLRKREHQDVQHRIAELDQLIAENSFIKSTQAGCILEMTAHVGQVVTPGSRLGTLQRAGEVSPTLETSVLYFEVKDGKQIQPGMKLFVTPSSVKRERFGSIVGEVTSVSPFPITREGAASVVGNPELADQLIGPEGGKIEVMARLQRDSTTFSGYQWTSSNGPQLKLTLGTTVTARATVEERAPITFLLPILREWSGLD